MCLSAIGSGVTNPVLNRYKNTNVPVTQISNLLATCALDNYGESNGERCGSCCFEGVDNPNLISALVLHNCETGEILDFQCPPKNLTCPDGQVCVEMSCWTLNKQCATESDDEISFDLCEDPCSVCDKLELLLLNCVKGQWISWRNANKSVSRERANIDLLKMLRNEYRARCRASRCEDSRCGLAFRPRC